MEKAKEGACLCGHREPSPVLGVSRCSWLENSPHSIVSDLAPICALTLINSLVPQRELGRDLALVSGWNLRLAAPLVRDSRNSVAICRVCYLRLCPLCPALQQEPESRSSCYKRHCSELCRTEACSNSLRHLAKRHPLSETLLDSLGCKLLVERSLLC